jgi:putative nucleotidyltransferase with HDIG domain
LGPNEASPGMVAVAGVEERRTRADWMSRYVTLVRLGALAFFAGLVYLQLTWEILPKFSIAGTAFFAALSFLADRYEIRTGSGAEVSAGFLADFLGAALLGPLSGAIVSSVGVFGGCRRGEFQRKVTSASVFQIVAGVTGLVFWVSRDRLGDGSWVFVVGGIASGLAYLVLNWVLFIPVAWFKHSTGPIEAFKVVVQPFLPFHLFFLALSLILVYSFKSFRFPLPILIFLPVLGLIYAIRSFANALELSRRLERFSLEMAAGMLTALDLKDNYTAQHSAAVAQYSFDMAKALGLSSRECNLAHLAGLLHDVGKISVPDDVLNFPGRLDAGQWAVIQDHSSAGQKILGNMNEFEELARVVLHHHERFDGNGYPQKLAGEEIPFLSRIVSVADCYSAMISNRPYRKKLPPEVAMREIVNESGRQFDPIVATRFLAVLEQKDEHYRLAEHVDFQMQFQKVRFLRDIS